MKFKQTDSFAQHYKINRQLGAGAFGTVKAGFHRRSKMPCAIKIIKKEKLSEHQIYEELNKNEFEVLEEVPVLCGATAVPLNQPEAHCLRRPGCLIRLILEGMEQFTGCGLLSTPCAPITVPRIPWSS